MQYKLLSDKHKSNLLFLSIRDAKSDGSKGFYAFIYLLNRVLLMVTKKKYSKVTSSKRIMPKKIAFAMVAPEAQNVFLVGDFNGWNVESHPLKKDSNGTWKISINLTPGRYQYRFLVDGLWRDDPNCTTFIPNSYGGENCLLILWGVYVKC